MMPLIFPTQLKPKFCHRCGHPIIGRYMTYRSGLIVCSLCQQQAQRCSHCYEPARELQKIGKQMFCKICLATLPRCGACGKPISGHYYRFGDSPQPYCLECAEQRPHCDVCGAPLGQDGQRLAGGQYRCGECSRTLVLDEQSVHDLYRAVIQQTQAILGITVQQIPSLVIAEPAQLAAVRRAYGDHEPQMPESSGQHIVGFFTQQGTRRTIYIERGLPRASLIGTLAHEYAHAWQADHTPREQDMLLHEGFAEWVSYRMLVALGHTREAARATRREDLYGEGLRYFITLEQQSGRQSVFAEATTQSGRSS
jgi:hypothetical protein